jgi:hypothetical protein
MPTKCYWDDPETMTIIRIDYEGDWTWEEYFKAADEGRRMAGTVSHRVDYITDLSRGRQPRSGSALSNGKTVLSRLAPNSGIVVNVVGAFEAVLLNVFKRFDKDLGNIMYGAKSVEEARKIIAQVREKASYSDT